MSKPNGWRPGVTGLSEDRRTNGSAPVVSRAMVTFDGPLGAAGGEGAGLGVLGASQGRAAWGFGGGVGGGFDPPLQAPATKAMPTRSARNRRCASGIAARAYR